MKCIQDVPIQFFKDGGDKWNRFHAPPTLERTDDRQCKQQLYFMSSHATTIVAKVSVHTRMFPRVISHESDLNRVTKIP